jgi:hypothetical protein
MSSENNNNPQQAEEIRQLRDHRVLPFAKLLPPDVVTVPETSFEFDEYQFESWCSRICNPYCPSMQAKMLGRYFSENNHDEISPIATFLNFHLASLIEALTGLTVLTSTDLTET